MAAMKFDSFALIPHGDGTFRLTLKVLPEEGENVRPVQLGHSPAEIPPEWQQLIAALEAVITKG